MKARFDGVLLLPSEALLICLGVLQSNSYLVGNLLWFEREREALIWSRTQRRAVRETGESFIPMKVAFFILES